MSGHFATLLRGTVDILLVDHDVYITDWHNARDIDCGKAASTLMTSSII
jgi:poly-beta-hydroxyalkanoate depolymerase